MFTRNEDATPVEMFPGVVRRTLNEGDRTMLVEIFIKEGAEVPAHTHPHEQIGYVARGRLRFRIGSEERELKAGDSYLVLGGAEHWVLGLEDTVAVDIFSPPREEYR